jgi:hypothetical protein
MIAKESLSMKKVGLWSLLITCGLLSVFILFISIISIWIGFGAMPRNGFWVPILAGTASMAFILFSFAGLIRIIRKKTKEKDLLDLD